MSDSLEPSPEIAEFLQEIASHRQDPSRGFLGRVQEASSVDSERDYEETVALGGLPVVTEVWAREEGGIWTTSLTPKDGFIRHYAEWRYPTIALWKRLGSPRQNPFEQEKRIWQIFLIESSLATKPLTFSGERLSGESLESIYQFIPPMIPSTLVQKFLKTTILSRSELSRIESECMLLWKTEGGSVRNPHPILQEVVTAMNLHERFGIATWNNINEVHVKVYAVIMKALGCYSDAQSQNMKEEEIRKKAVQAAGIGHLTGMK